MSLYKRVYPKWGELWTEKRGLAVREEKDVDAMEE